MGNLKNWLALAVVLGCVGVASACPNCKDTIANTDSASSPGLSGAFNSSIYVMLGAFIGVLGLVFRVMYKAIRGSTTSLPVRPPSDD